jgi:hypothetical protein
MFSFWKEKKPVEKPVEKAERSPVVKVERSPVVNEVYSVYDPGKYRGAPAVTLWFDRMYEGDHFAIVRDLYKNMVVYDVLRDSVIEKPLRMRTIKEFCDTFDTSISCATADQVQEDIDFMEMEKEG